MASFNETYQGYENKLKELTAQCTEAEKNVIATESTLKSLNERRAELIKECEQYTGLPIDKVPESIEKMKQDLDNIMTTLSGINLEGEISEETLAAIEAIAKEQAAE